MSSQIESRKIFIEQLSEPKKLFATMPSDQLTNLLSDHAKIWASSIEKPLSNFDNKPFLYSMIEAYENHCPYRLSPDMIWLLILQAFARNVLANAENLRSKFVDFHGQKELTVVHPEFFPDSMTKEDWAQIFSEFTEQIGQSVGEELVKDISPDFTTTTPLSLTVCQLTVMSTFQKYFSYHAHICGCGIPYVTLEGSVSDWEKVQNKLGLLKKYDFSWFVKSVDPIIQNIINSVKGNVDQSFWKNMLRKRGDGSFYNPYIYDGWILNFYPFSSSGKQREYIPIRADRLKKDIPSELLDVPLILTFIVTGETFNLTVRSGFVGISQDPQTFEVKPEVGWMILQKQKTDSD